MFSSQVISRYRKGNNNRLHQGDILKDLDFVFGDPKKDTEKDVVSLPYAVILSQDCDLQSDFKCVNDGEDQYQCLMSLLVCPAFLLDTFSQGEHLGEWAMEKYNARQIDKIKGNDVYKRYHFLRGDAGLSIPEMVIDFKHFFTLPRDFMYSQKNDKYVASLNELFREELSQRFSSYLSRIGLPEV